MPCHESLARVVHSYRVTLFFFFRAGMGSGVQVPGCLLGLRPLGARVPSLVVWAVIWNILDAWVLTPEEELRNSWVLESLFWLFGQ